MALSLDKSIQSVLAQSFTDWELLIVDNCSTDHPDEIVKRYSDDKRIRLLSIDEKDRSKARNHGIANSNGDYITFLDADDTLHEDYLKTYAIIFEKEPILLCISDLTVIGPSGSYVLKKSRYMHLPQLNYALNYGHISIAGPREVLMQYKFDGQIGEDRFYLAAMSNEIKFLFTKKPFYFYNDEYIISSGVILKKRFDIEFNSLSRYYSNCDKNIYLDYSFHNAIFDQSIRNFYVAKFYSFDAIAREILFSSKIKPYSFISLAKYLKVFIYYYIVNFKKRPTGETLEKEI